MTVVLKNERKMLPKQTHHALTLQDQTYLTNFLLRQTNNYGYL